MDAKTPANGTFSFTLAAEWDYVPKKDIRHYIANCYSMSIDDRLNMNEAVQLLLAEGQWEPYAAVTDISTQGLFPIPTEGTEPTKAPLYNEYLYFNSHMRRMVYNQTEYDKNAGVKKHAKRVAQNGDAVVVLNWQPCINKDYAYYLYRYMGGNHLREYSLPISSIELRLYAIGVVLLTIRCQDEQTIIQKKPDETDSISYTWRDLNMDGTPTENPPDHKEVVATVDDLSWIENCGRRVFASRPCGGERDSSFFNDFPAFSMIAPVFSRQNVKWKDLRTDKGNTIICDFLSLLTGKSKNEKKHLPEYLTFIHSLLPCCVSKMQLKSDPAKYRDDLIVLDSYNDDRMYLHGTVISKDIDEATGRGWQNRETPVTAYDDLSPWYGILYSDAGWKATCQDQQMLVDAVKNATDARWLDYGTFHGMTYHSMLMLISDLNNDTRFLIANNDWIYLQMFLIAVLQRCAIQRFYREASGLLQTHTSHDDALRTAVQGKYTLFLNQFWFFEVTEQEQGKMLFARLQKAMNVKDDVEFLDRALDELHQQAENKMGNMVNKLLVPMSILGGFWAFTEMSVLLWKSFGVTLFEGENLFSLDHAFAIFLLVSIVIAFIAYLINQGCYILHLFPDFISNLFSSISSLFSSITSLFSGHHRARKTGKGKK